MSSFEPTGTECGPEPSLFSRFVAERNIYAAYHRVLSKKSAGGIDRVSVDEFAGDHHRNLLRLRRELMQGQYNPEPVKAASIPKFNDKGEFRQLGLPTVRDKIVQAALLQVVEPLTEKLFLDTSYGYRKQKGHRKAIGRVEDNLSRHKHWIVRQDVDNFFDTLDHNRLLSLFAQLVNQEQQLVDIIALWCRSGIVARSGKWRNVETGVRQGQIISPLLANLYLHDLDMFVRDRGWAWVRYADDFLIMVQDEATAQEADTAIKQFLEQKLHLQLNENAAPISNLDKGFSFLGVHFFKDVREISPKKIDKMRNQVGWLLSPKNMEPPEKILATLERTTSGWLQHYGFLNPTTQFQALEQMITQKFTQLAQDRVTKGLWPAQPPADLRLPFLLPFTEDIVKENQKRLRQAWPAKQLNPVSRIIKKADEKAAVKRRRHLRHKLAEGEVIVTTPGHFVGLRGQQIVVKRQQVVIAEIPANSLTGLTLGEHGLALSTDVIKLCVERDISIYCINYFGKILAVVNRPDSVNADLLQKQIIHRDDETGLMLARMFIFGKVKNQLALLKFFSKYRERRNSCYGQTLIQMREELERLVKKIQNLPITDPNKFRTSLMGMEGVFAVRYWTLLALLIPADLGFPGRERRGAKDLVNAMFNYGYGILYSQILTAVTKAGLSATSGFLHTRQGKKPVLTYDLIEEFRAPVVDRTVLGMLNRREVFRQEEGGALDKETRRKLAAAITARLGSEVLHRGQKDTLQNILFAQARTIREQLLGKGTYKPYLMRW
ncbi:MAG: CRISPR-associated endonuclease Cas1 [bacterium]|nr:CRISPR-associated endonuclease Cas1 [bacterium]